MKNIFKGFFIILLLFVTSGDIFACDKCFGAQVDSPTTQGISMAMLALLGMTGGVGSGIILFFFRLKRRVKRRPVGFNLLPKELRQVLKI